MGSHVFNTGFLFSVGEGRLTLRTGHVPREGEGRHILPDEVPRLVLELEKGHLADQVRDDRRTEVWTRWLPFLVANVTRAEERVGDLREFLRRPLGHRATLRRVLVVVLDLDEDEGAESAGEDSPAVLIRRGIDGLEGELDHIPFVRNFVLTDVFEPDLHVLVLDEHWDCGLCLRRWGAEVEWA